MTDLETKWERYFFERYRDIKHLQSLGFCLDVELGPAPEGYLND